MIWLSIAAGGALGAVSRYGVTLGAARLGATGFPYATLTVNVIGSFLIGLFVAWLGGRTEINPALRPLIQVGFLGALTTFSTFSLDALILIEQGRFTQAGLYIAASVLICLAACFIGLLAGRSLGF
ncbi:fluoride efflux transporter CrcB [Litoricolaceae bacterium]|nr:fluoride efflux transporter CrcB [Litorivicinaceae bacterium]